MAKVRAKHNNCSVVGCRDQHPSLHRPPASEDIKAAWVHFIFYGSGPVTVNKNLFVCANHFAADCFSNLGQYNAGLAKKLFLKEGSIPSVRGRGEGQGDGSSHLAISHRHQASQTDPPSLSTVATQLSIKTLKEHVRSRGSQTDPNLLNTEDGIDSESLKRYYKQHAVRLVTAKRPWVTASLKDMCLLPRMSSLQQETDSSTSERGTSSGGTPKDVCFGHHMDVTSLEDVCVNLGCLLQLFQRCGECRGVCTVTTTGDRQHFSVLGRCEDCSEQTAWSSQRSQVTGDQVNPSDEEDIKPPEFLTTTSASAFELGVNEGQWGADSVKSEKSFVEVDVMIDSEGEQSVEDDARDEAMNGLGAEMEEREEMDEEEEEEEQMDEDDEDWELGQEENEDSESDSDEGDHRDKKVGKPTGRPKGGQRDPYARRDPLLCPDCGVTYTTRTHRCHDTFLRCPECNVRCLNEASFQVHKVDCKGKRYVCKYCLKPFASWDDKIDHEKQSHPSTEKDPFMCSECPQRFSRLSKRRRHLREHRKNVCQTCNKEFKSGHALTRHKMSHISEKPFKCKVCGRAFAQACQLKCHMRIHTGEQPYKCHLCARSFNHNVSLKSHLQRHHKPEDQDQPASHSLVTT